MTARAAHAQKKAQTQGKSSAPVVMSKKVAPAASVFSSMTSLPVPQHKPPVPVSTVKPVVSKFDSVASMPAAQKLQPALVKGKAVLVMSRLNLHAARAGERSFGLGSCSLSGMCVTEPKLVVS